MHDLGISVAPRSIVRKKEELEAEQDERIKRTVTMFVEQREKMAKASPATCSSTGTGT